MSLELFILGVFLVVLTTLVLIVKIHHVNVMTSLYLGDKLDNFKYSIQTILYAIPLTSRHCPDLSV